MDASPKRTRHSRWTRRVWNAALMIIAMGAATTTVAQSPHEPFDGLLTEHVRDGWVDYPAVSKDPRLASYLEVLANRSYVDLPRDEQLAHLINAYNAFAIKGILDGSSPSSFFGRVGYFKIDEYTLGGREISLYDLEHDLLIPLNEPRAHFAINCASASCPVLRSGVYSPRQLDRQLDEGARRFVNDPTRNRFDREARIANLSRIFDWYEDDFLAHADSLLAYVARYVDDPSVAAELASGDWTVEFLDYDWTLNGIAPDS